MKKLLTTLSAFSVFFFFSPIALAAITHHYTCSDTLNTFSTFPSCSGDAWTFSGNESIVDQDVEFNAAINTTYYVSFTHSGTGAICVAVGNTFGNGLMEDRTVVDLALTKGAAAANSLSIDDRNPGTFNLCSGSDGTFVGTISNLCISDTPGQCGTTTNTINRLAKFITSSTIGDSLFSDDGSNTTLTAGNLFMQIGSLIDTPADGALNFGTTNATTINIGRIGVTTTIPTLLVGKQSTSANCNSTAFPAICGSAPSGSVAMAAGGSTLVVNTTAVTANSQILITEDSSLGLRLGIPCNTATGRVYSISARSAGTNFTIKSSAKPVTANACLSYWIIN